ncbi:hypothetical protein CFIMG_001646RA [Ceratocystis fimbriata CBS 114723]|uniref:Uncharacterized protein n=1 Tax=Ceratocystis fimbriata CBS 114723 TaxID=1035309 RepID=A0A2C5XIP6_9PEZI|nr:hypothetical protein CFIMG_001646RA [Ceratocystis fimbriata CBS 114723]
MSRGESRERDTDSWGETNDVSQELAEEAQKTVKAGASSSSLPLDAHAEMDAMGFLALGS